MGSSEIVAKAQRLIEDGRVHQVNGDGTVFVVEGDSGAYLVAVVDPSATRRLDAPAGMCSCEAAKHGQACSHIVCARWMFDRLHEDVPGRT